MQAVILAAGKGTRMGDLTKDTPKPLLKIGEKTILEHNLSELPDETDEVIIVVGYFREQIKKLIGESYRGKKIIYVEQKELNGTAGALLLCKDLLRGRFLMMYGDDLYNGRDLEKLIKYPLAILVTQLKENRGEHASPAIVKLNDAGELLDIVERQEVKEGMLVNTGAYVLNEDYFKYPMVVAGRPAGEYGVPQTFLQMVRDGAKFAVVPAEKWLKITAPEDLLEK